MKLFPVPANYSLTRPSQGLWFLSAVLLLLVFATVMDVQAAASNSIARVWDERALAAIRNDTPHPPAQARNLYSFSVCMYDAWAAYDTNAVGYIYRGKHTAGNIAAGTNGGYSFLAQHGVVCRFAKVPRRLGGEPVPPPMPRLHALANAF